MSLFQVRSWWEHSSSGGEEFDRNHLIVDNIDNSPADTDKIVTASLEGTIRVYFPVSKGYDIQHLVLEENLNQPILQIARGLFSSRDNLLYLAVLHPRSLVVYALNAVGGWGLSAQYYELKAQYTHRLDRNAFNFIFGKFGNGAKDSICVQSIDGRFWVFEQEQLSFHRDWNNFIVPMPITYLPYSDCIITSNANMKLYCYKYNVLLSSSSSINYHQMQLQNALNTQPQQPTTSSSSLQKSWHVNIGDYVVCLFSCPFTINLAPKQSDIIAVCERSIFAVGESGDIRWQLKLDYNPIAAHPYRPNKGRQPHNIIVASAQNSIHIYGQCKLLWEAHLHFSPIDIQIGSFGNIDGMQVLLSDSGTLLIGYLGTDASGYMPVHIQNKSQPFEIMENELRQLKKTIAQLQNTSVIEAESYLELNVSCDNTISYENAANLSASIVKQTTQNSTGDIKCCKAMVSLKYNGNGSCTLDNIQIIVNSDAGLPSNQSQIFIPKLCAESLLSDTEIIFFASKSIIPTCRKVSIYVTYFNDDDKMQIAQSSFQLPFALMARTIPPIKNTQFVLTVDASAFKPMAPVQLFEDMITDTNNKELTRTPQVLSVALSANDTDVTMVLSKKGGKIRIQSGHFGAMWIVINELIQRLKANTDNNNARITLKAKSLPLDPYFDIISQRWQLRESMVAGEKRLENLSKQFRIIQKRLLARFRDKNPTPLNEMDTLLYETHSAILEESQKMEKYTTEMETISRECDAATALFREAIALFSSEKYDDRNVDLLQCYLPLHNATNSLSTDDPMRSWVETVDIAIVCALRTCLAKSHKDTTIHQIKFGQFNDIQKLFKHIRIFCERLQHCQRFTDQPIFDE